MEIFGRKLTDQPWWAYSAAAVLLFCVGLWLLVRPLTAFFTIMLLPLLFTGLHAPAAVSFANTAVIVIGLWMIYRSLKRKRGQQRTTSRRQRLTWISCGLALILAAITGSIWPDVALVSVGVTFAIGVILGAVALLGYGRNTARRHSGMQPVQRQTAIWGRVAVIMSLLAVLVTGSVAVYAAQASTTPEIPEFYSAPDVSGQQPGTLLRVEPYDGDLPDGLTAQRLLYVTTDLYGTAVAASAVLAVPSGATDVPLITWAHGTIGVAQHCAPSLVDNAVTPQSIPNAELFAANGWAVVATDYPGMGVDGVFPYLIGEGQGRAVLDAARAALSITETDWSDDVAIWGHSQGGHAALWAGQLAQTYAPELNVVGTAALSPASRPYELATGILANPAKPGATLALSFVVDSYTQSYVQLPFAQTVTPMGKVIVGAAVERCTDSRGTVATALVGLAIARDTTIVNMDLFRTNFGRILQENEAKGPWNAPLLIGQGIADEVIPYEINVAYSNDLCEAGIDHTLTGYAEQSHMGVIAPGSELNAEVAAWTSALFLGDEPPTASACGSTR